jgi:putative FmdB family regulatory protein
MPIYEYRCQRGHTFEVRQNFSDDPVSVCEVCSKPVARVFHPVAVHFKGSGFYNTDYGTKKRSREMNEAKENKKSADSNGASDSKSDSKSSDSKGSEAKKSDSGTKKSEAKAKA